MMFYLERVLDLILGNIDGMKLFKGLLMDVVRI